MQLRVGVLVLVGLPLVDGLLCWWMRFPLVGRGVAGVQVGARGVFVPLGRIFGVEAGVGARVGGFADARVLAPAAGTGAPEGLE